MFLGKDKLLLGAGAPLLLENNYVLGLNIANRHGCQI